jgi:hypothetical protein
MADLAHRGPPASPWWTWKVKMPEKVEMVVQDRAYTSPIWYTPSNWKSQNRDRINSNVGNEN